MTAAFLMLSVEKGNNTKQEQDDTSKDAVFFQFALGEIDSFIGIFSDYFDIKHFVYKTNFNVHIFVLGIVYPHIYVIVIGKILIIVLKFHT